MTVRKAIGSTIAATLIAVGSFMQPIQMPPLARALWLASLALFAGYAWLAVLRHHRTGGGA